MTGALTTSGLGKRYRGTWALSDCDLTLPAGGVIALVGPNGAGKTTFLHLASGLIAPTTGSLTVSERRLPAGSAGALAELGFVSQDHAVYRRFRVSDLLRMGSALNRSWDQAIAERRLADLGIPLGQRAGSLSGGQQAQVALALALAKRPRLLILDEPVASLDPLARREFMQILMASVADQELTVLLSSHNVGELERVCDHLVVIAGGRVQLAGDIDELLADHRVLTGPRAVTFPGGGVIDVTSSRRNTHLVARTGGVEPVPTWQSQPIGLEELVLAYLRRAREDAASERVEMPA